MPVTNWLDYFDTSDPSEHLRHMPPDASYKLAGLGLTRVILSEDRAPVGIGLTFKANDLNEKMLKFTRHGDSLATIQTNISNIQLQISQRQDTTSVDLNHFAQLLGKTDAVITTAQNQLSLETYKKDINDKGEKNRFIAAMFRLGAKIGNRENANQWTEGSKITYDLIEIFESQMNNPFLCSNDRMLKLWINAYVHLHIIGHQGSCDSAFGEGFDIRAKTKIDEISITEMNRDQFHVWDAVNEAYSYCGKSVKRESSSFLKN